MTENNGFSINVDQEAEGFFGSRQLLPPGWHDMVITTAARKPNKAGTGTVLHIEFDTGIKSYLNIIHPNATAQRIGRSELAKIVQSIGMTGNFSYPGDIPKTFGRRLQCEVIQEEQPDGKVFNRIVNYRAVEAKQPAKPAEKPTPNNSDAPW